MRTSPIDSEAIFKLYEETQLDTSGVDMKEIFGDLRENKDIKFHTCIIYQSHLKNKLIVYYIKGK